MATHMDALYSRKTFDQMDEDFRIGATVSDGMWWSYAKWKQYSKASDEYLQQWISEALNSGRLVQSATGQRSYRFPLESIHEWYSAQGLEIGVQLVDFLFPPRIWDGMTEPEGFLNAPLREIGYVTFSCSPKVAAHVTQALMGIARVREIESGRYRAFALSSDYASAIIRDVFKQQGLTEKGSIHARFRSYRREMIDFTPAFARGLVLFYGHFGKTLSRKAMDTIKLFIPEEEDRESQIIAWVIAAIEKFDEASSVPFSGYLDNVLKHWPYDLPYDHLGKELSNFQRKRSRAIKVLQSHYNSSSQNFPNSELAYEAGMTLDEFNELEEKHHIWLGMQYSTTITWDDGSEEKAPVDTSSQSSVYNTGGTSNDIALAHRLSLGVVKTALTTEAFDDALTVIKQIDSSNADFSAELDGVSDTFIEELGANLGVNNRRA